MTKRKTLFEFHKTHCILLFTTQKWNNVKDHDENLLLNVLSNKLDIVIKTKYRGVQIVSFIDRKGQIKVISTKISRAVGF